MKKILLILTLLPFFLSAQLTYVPDDAFEAYLETHTSAGWGTVPVGDPNSLGNGIANDNYVTTAKISGLTSLDVSIGFSGGSIADLTGIEDFIALTHLECSENQLTNLDLISNAALSILECSENQLTNLDLSSNAALSILVCFENQLTNLDLSSNTVLTTLYCGSNPLTGIDVSNNTALEYLRCENNQLASLDVSNNTALTILECSNNTLTNLDVSNNTALIDLYCEYNQLTSLDVSQNTALTDLGCGDNQLTSLDVSQNTALTLMRGSINQLTCLNVRNGNNTNMNILVNSNPNLSCIEVDDPAWSTINWTTIIDSQTSFSTNCNYPAGCFSNSISIQEIITTISLYPNPTNNGITLDIDGYNGSINVEVYDLQGRLLKTTTNTTISMGEYANGIYVFKVAYGDRTQELKVVKE